MADFDADGHQDQAVTNFSGYVTILLGDGAGDFVQPLSSPEAVTGLVLGVAAADLNQDGDMDLAATSGSTDSLVRGPAR